MAARYQIFLKDQSGTVVARFDDWQNLRYTKRVNRVHDWAIQLRKDHPAIDLLQLDGQIEVYRSDLANGIDWYLDLEGLYRTPVRQVFLNGNEIFTAYGYGYTETLMRRSTMYPAGTAFVEKNDVAETVMKEFVDENIGPSANDANRWANGVMAGFSLEADGAGGSNWQGARAYRNLLSVVQDVAKESGTYFDVVGVGDALYEFRFYTGQRGTDRSIVGLDASTGLNGAGNAPVIFSVERGNVQELAHSENRSDEGNAIFALGQGIEEDREVQEVTDAAAIADSPINRRELTTLEAQETTTQGLIDAATAKLNQRGERIEFSFNPLRTSNVFYGKDYFWGDKVTCRFRDEDFNLVFTEVGVQVAGENEIVNFQVSNVN